MASMGPEDNIVDSEEQPSYRQSPTPALKKLLKKMSPNITRKKEAK